MNNPLARLLAAVLALAAAAAVIGSGPGGSGTVEAQTPSYGTRYPAQDFDTLAAAGNKYPEGIWSDGTTMWVADSAEDKIYAYKMSDKSRDSSKDVSLDSALTPAPTGIWSDGATMWVTDYSDDAIYAYKMSDKSRDSSRDFTLDSALTPAPTGIWSDGATMWVTDAHYDKIYAYKMSDKSRDSSKDVTLEASYPYGGIWSDGTTMWVADFWDEKLYAYGLGLTSTPGRQELTEDTPPLTEDTPPLTEDTPAPPPQPRVRGPWRVSVAEEGDTAVGSYTALFSGLPIVPAWSLSGADAALFAIDAAGALAFLDPPDFEQPRDHDAAAPRDNVYVVTVNATADNGETGARTVRVTVTDAGGRFHVPPAGAAAGRAGILTAFTGSLAQLREELTDACPGGAAIWSSRVRGDRARWVSYVPGAPVPAADAAFEAPPAGGFDWTPLLVTRCDTPPPAAFGVSGPAGAAVAEGRRAVEGYAASGAEGVAVAWSLSGEDAALFAIHEGALRFAEPPDHESPGDGDGDNVHLVTVEARGGAASASRDVTVRVTDREEPLPDERGFSVRPAREGFTLTTFTGTLADLRAAMAAHCPSGGMAMWTPIGGAWTPYIPPALVPAVNAAFIDAFPAGFARTPLLAGPCPAP